MNPLIPPIGTADSLFHDGNPATGELGTIVSAEWLNNMQAALRGNQSELIALLTAAGIEPSAAKADQVLTALRALFLGKAAQAADSAKLDSHPASYFATADDLAALSGRSSMPAGVLMPYMGISQPAWGLPLLGGSVSRASYPKLFAVLCPVIAATTAAGSGVVTVTSTMHWYAGMPIEDARFATGTTVVSIDSATTAILSNTAATTGSGQLRIFLFGYGAGGNATTFGLPLGAGDYLRAYDSGRAREKWTLTGNMASGSNVITGIASTRGILIGSTVAHANISGSGVTVTKITANSITLSSTATANVTGAAIVMTGLAIGAEGNDEILSHTHTTYSGPSSYSGATGVSGGIFGVYQTLPTGGPENNVRRLIVGMYICHGESV
ncbi:hypothetical protein [Laribacter hongkongensis]|uniref:Putative phage tail protein n=1 Tax=Laribacter hongkongensis TaxID=168471 RepID=A0A248LHE9_9NEIS|nr:hypothetical protein [Laribacter hongkongensis]ASJ24167.1 putative phage tail protein [Laribacter hongkongensis]MCG9058203.1 hypothetical protein [Laribacter hongkongensis]MCG9088066.1 hypothetical protein [Laribacter hongkongensis]MCG9110373.1 hypothetical protein [Laribacter hongkongensis]MCG9121508.1 hypothetical protein [Laribacter hongkongensis]